LQPVEIVGVLIAAGDSKDAGAQNVGQQMDDRLASRPSGITAARRSATPSRRSA
jgi:hypothetical protein